MKILVLFALTSLPMYASTDVFQASFPDGKGNFYWIIGAGSSEMLYTNVLTGKNSKGKPTYAYLPTAGPEGNAAILAWLAKEKLKF